MTESSFLQVLKINNFRKIWISQILSQITINLINFVIVLRVFESTHSTVAVSLVWIFYAMPSLLLGPLSGTIVDLAEKRKILVFTTLAEAFIVLLYLFMHTKIWPIYSVVFLYSLVNQLYIPAEASTLTLIVPKRLLSVANTIFLFTIYSTLLIGFGAAGPLIRLVGRSTPFIISSVFLVTASLSVYQLPKSRKKTSKRIEDMGDFWKKVKEGYEFIQKEKEVLFPLGLLVLANVIVSIFAVIAPLFGTELLSIELLDIGYVVILPLGFGSILGSLGIVSLLKHTRKKRIISAGLFLLTVSLFFLGLVLPTIHSFRVPIAMFAIFLLGVGLVSLFIPAQTSIQEKTPPGFRGRVFGVLGFLFTLASVLPILLVATMADIIGVSWVIFLIGVVLGGVAIYSLKEPYLNNLNHGKN